MRVVALRLVTHHEQVAASQVAAPTFAGRPMPQHEPSTIPQTDRGDGGARAELWLIVTVVAHGVSTVAIEIGQARVNVDGQLTAEALPQVDHRLRPWAGLVHDPGVTVGTVPHPGRQSWCRHRAPVERDDVLLPVNLVPERREQLVSVGNPTRVVIHAGWRLIHDQ